MSTKTEVLVPQKDRVVGKVRIHPLTKVTITELMWCLRTANATRESGQAKGVMYSLKSDTTGIKVSLKDESVTITRE